MTISIRDIQREEVMTVIELGKPKPTKADRPKKTKRPPIDKYRIMAERGKDFPYVSCDCGCGQHGHDLHHCFIGRKKGVPQLDDERNLVLVNHLEHINRTFDNREWRIKFWKIQCDRYGEAAMLEWVNSLPEKMRGRIDWLND